MIILTPTTPQQSVNKHDASEDQASDKTGLAEDFLQQVRTAKASLTGETEATTLLNGAALRKAAGKNEGLKLAAEHSTGKTIPEPQDTLAALLTPQDKSTTAIKNLLREKNKTDTDSSPDLQAISALLGMLPQHLPSTRSALSTLTGQPAVASKATGVSLATTPKLVTSQTADPDSPSTAISEHSADRIALTEEKVNLRVADNPASSANNQPPFNPAISSSASLISTGSAIATPATSILNSQLGSQEWQQQLSQHIMLFTRQGQQQAELRLHPEHLGKVEISLKLDDNQLQLQIMSPHSHVRAALEAALPLLRTSLSESGLQLSQSQVGGDSSTPQQHTEQREQQASRQQTAFPSEHQDDEVTASVMSETLQRLAHGKGAVDTFA